MATHDEMVVGKKYNAVNEKGTFVGVRIKRPSGDLENQSHVFMGGAFNYKDWTFQLVEETEGMNFIQAVEQMRNGQYVARRGWSNPPIHNWTIIKGRITTKENSEFAYSQKDLEANDWYVIEKTETVKLTSEYTAVVSKDKITVGCTDFPATKVAELAEALKRVQA